MSIWRRARGTVRTSEEAVADWLSALDSGASEAASGEVAAPEMAVSERRGLARRSPAEWGQRLLLLLLLHSCSGRIHRLALTVSPSARRAAAGGAVLSPRSPWFGVVSPYLPLCLRRMERSAAPPASRPRVVSSEESPSVLAWGRGAAPARVMPHPLGGRTSPPREPQLLVLCVHPRDRPGALGPWGSPRGL